MTVRSDVHHDVSPALRDLPTIVQGATVTHHEAEPARFIPLPPGLKPASQPDPVLQRTVSAPTLLAPAVNLGFDGIGQGVFGYTVQVAPPDTNGAVGLTQYVQWVNLHFAVFNKSTGALIAGPTPGNFLWSGFGGGCQNNNDGDPIITYDKLANRWVFSQFVVHGSFLQCVAVSTTSDATGTYNRYAFQYANFDDYPKMGVWPDAYYVTFNMFNSSGTSFLGADACAYNRNAMLNGQPATQICFQQGSSVGGLLPSDVDGTTPPPAGSPNFMLFFGSNALKLFKFHVNFVTPSASTFTGPVNIPVAAFTPLCNGGSSCVPQAGTTTALDSLADRLMYRLAYRNFGNHESLVVNHSVAAGTSGGVRWYEIQNPSGTPVVAQQSTFAPDSKFRWMGSIAMDKMGDMALGYSVSSSAINPAIAFTGRLATDPTSTMQPETPVINGTGSQTGGLTRWGDYSAMQVDPVDDCTFWYTTEYLKTSGSFNWNTRIANFKFPGCGKDFTLSATPPLQTVVAGNGTSYTVTVAPLNGFNSDVTLSVVSSLPAGVQVSFIPNPILGGSGTSTMNVTTSPTTPGGSYPITIQGQGGGLTHTTNVTLVVLGRDFSVSATPSSQAVTAGGGTSYTVTVSPVNGFTGNVTLTVSGLPSGASSDFPKTITGGSGSTTLNVTTSSTTPGADFNLTITGTSGSLVHSATVTLVVHQFASGTMDVTGTVIGWGFVQIQIASKAATVFYDDTGANGLPTVATVATAIADAFNTADSPVTATAAPVPGIPAGFPDDWHVQFVTKQTGPNVNYTVTSSVSPAFTFNLLVTPPNGNAPAGTQDYAGFLTGGH